MFIKYFHIAYSSSLVSYLSMPKRYRPLDTLQQLASSEGSYDIRVYPGTHLVEMFSLSYDSHLNRIAELMKSQKHRYTESVYEIELDIMHQSNLVIFENDFSFITKRESIGTGSEDT